MRMRLVRALYYGIAISACVGLLIFAISTEAPPADKKLQEKMKVKRLSLATIQEVGFDQYLERFELCYGVKFSSERTSNSRRQTCKAILVHDIGDALAGSGTHFGSLVRFHCQNTAKGATRFFDSDGIPVFRLKPNQEHTAIRLAISNYLVQSNNPAGWLRGQKACAFHVDCQKRLKWSEVNFNTINRCIFQAGAEDRRLFWDSVRATIFNIFRRQPLMSRHISAGI